ncbi:MAG: serine/threonine-protein kinase, partial [Planctomycetota bacterium]
LELLDLLDVTQFEARFKGLNKPSEGAIAMQMRHPLIVETYEVGKNRKGQPFLVMEFIPGPPMQSLIAEGQANQLMGKRLKLIRDMAGAIRYVHENGFIHRDICPRNFICLPDVLGAKLIDFGLTVPKTRPFMAPGNRTGTPLYMSPEIVRRRATDERVDIFSFGVSCYVLCTLQHPWQDQETTGRAALHHDTKPPTDIFEHRPDLNQALGRAIMQAMHPDVMQRTESMETFLKQIEKVQSETE